jgi:hypothetical protein
MDKSIPLDIDFFRHLPVGLVVVGEKSSLVLTKARLGKSSAATSILLCCSCS